LRGSQVRRRRGAGGQREDVPNGAQVGDRGTTALDAIEELSGRPDQDTVELRSGQAWQATYEKRVGSGRVAAQEGPLKELSYYFCLILGIKKLVARDLAQEVITEVDPASSIVQPHFADACDEPPDESSLNLLVACS
jgi:hypothetical protein